MFESAYIATARSGELHRRAESAREALRHCLLCPRNCGVDRLSGELGYCQTGALAVVSSFGPHFGEEEPLVGRGGSGTIFFASCNLRCVFCQNFDISHEIDGREVEPERLAAIMLHLQEMGCHNVNFVTPSHVVAQILAALEFAVANGLRVPLVYNTGGYDALDTLRLLDGVVDIYMPDLKCMDRDVARIYLNAENYPDVVQAAIREMHRQVGDLQVAQVGNLRNTQVANLPNDTGVMLGNRKRQVANLPHSFPPGLALRGLLVRHLVMPNSLAGTAEAARFLADDISRDTYINVMAQYRPCGLADNYPPIARPVTAEEYETAVSQTLAAGLHRLDSRVEHRRVRWL